MARQDTIKAMLAAFARNYSKRDDWPDAVWGTWYTALKEYSDDDVKRIVRKPLRIARQRERVDRLKVVPLRSGSRRIGIERIDRRRCEAECVDVVQERVKRQVRIVTDRRIEIGNRTLSPLPEYGDRIARNRRGLGAEFADVVGLRHLPQRLRREHRDARFPSDLKTGLIG